MDEEEYLEGEPFNEDDGFTEHYLIDEPPDVDFIMMPKLDIDIDKIIDHYVNDLRKCRTKDDARHVLLNLYVYAQTISTIENEIQELQTRAKSLEILTSELNIK